MRRRILQTLLAFTLLGGLVAAWWLTRRPLRYQPPVASNLDLALEEPMEEVVDAVDELEPPDAGTDVSADAEPVLLAEPEPEPEPELPAMPLEPSVRPSRVATSLDDVETYLLVGVDHTRGAWGRADTLVAAIFDDETGHVGLVSIPRDLYVDVPGHGMARINASLRIAVRQEEDPLDVIGEVVGAVLDLPIEHVVVADISSFERTVDALGGLDVEVPCGIQDSFHDDRTETGRRALDVEAGEQHMDGLVAAMYVRSRHGRSDWDRARRQQAVLTALRRKVRTMGVSEWVPVLTDALEGGVITSMSRLEMLSVARRVRRLDERRIHGLLIGSRQTSHHRTDDGKRVLLPDYEAIDDSLGGLFEAPAPGVRRGRRRCPDPAAALQRNYGS